MTNTIPNVPRQLLERAATSIERRMCIQCEGFPCCMPESLNTLSDIRALLSAPSPAGVDGPVRNFKTREGYDVWDKLCAIPKFGFLIGPSGGVVKVADIGNWIDRDEAQSVVDEAQCEVNLLRHEAADAQAIIDGLRGEVADLRSMLATVSQAGLRVRTERDQQAQRIGELEGLLMDVAGMFHGPGIEGGPLTKLRRRLNAALSAGKERG